jgi:hypothetical protein
METAIAPLTDGIGRMLNLSDCGPNMPCARFTCTATPGPSDITIFDMLDATAENMRDLMRDPAALPPSVFLTAHIDDFDTAAPIFEMALGHAKELGCLDAGNCDCSSNRFGIGKQHGSRNACICDSRIFDQTEVSGGLEFRAPNGRRRRMQRALKNEVVLWDYMLALSPHDRGRYYIGGKPAAMLPDRFAVNPMINKRRKNTRL